jgi:PAS domain S-box-containing protein
VGISPQHQGEAPEWADANCRAVLEAAPDAMLVVNRVGEVVAANQQAQKLYGYGHEQLIGRVVESLIPARLRDRHQQHRENFFANPETKFMQVLDIFAERSDGSEIPVDVSLSRLPIGSETFAISAIRDTTDRNRAEDLKRTEDVSRRLIEAQEQERTRIGRELHDDIGQRLSLLAIQLQQLNENSVILPEVRSSMGELHKQISEIAVDIQSLSHELHSAKLQYLGMAAAMKGFCREFGEQQKVEIDFQSHDLPSPASADVSLCFFRVLQEALHNSAKHSGVRHFEVRLWGTSDEIHLTIKDSGAGFDREAAKTSRGLGLISMEERLRLVKGTLSVDSQPKRGTTIHARVPLSSGSDSMRAAG